MALLHYGEKKKEERAHALLYTHSVVAQHIVGIPQSYTYTYIYTYKHMQRVFFFFLQENTYTYETIAYVWECLCATT